MRQSLPWNLGARTIELGRRTLVMGIVNVTPDSFSDGALFVAPERAAEHALRLLAEGADIVDFGGESTRPGTAVSTGAPGELATISDAEEQDRVLPPLEMFKRERPQAVASIDTYRASTANAAVHAGAEIINDVSGFHWDREMAATAARLGCGVVLMHSRGRPSEWNSMPPEPELLALVHRGLSQSVDRARAAGVERDRIVLDPGFGFGKRFDENYQLLAHLPEFAELGFPLLVGTSRKGFLGLTVAKRLVELGVWKSTSQPPMLPPAERLFGTLASVVAAVLKGAYVVRVHDVRAAVEAVAVADAILAAG